MRWFTISLFLALSTAIALAQTSPPIVVTPAPATTSAPVEVGEGRRPLDPTALTTQLVWREIAALRDLFNAKLQGASSLNAEKIIALRAEVFQRFDGMDKAIELIQAEADKVPSKTDIAIGGLKQWVEAQLKLVNTQIVERDDRVRQTSDDQKVAINAALEAQKQSVDKQNESNAQSQAKAEANFAKLLEGLEGRITLGVNSLDDKITGLRDRLTTIEGRTAGGTETRGESQDSTMAMIAVIGGIVSFISLMFAVYMATRKPPAREVVYETEPLNGHRRRAQ